MKLIDNLNIVLMVILAVVCGFAVLSGNILYIG